MEFIWDPEKCTLLLPFSEIAIPRRVVDYAAEQGMRQKSELHVTLLSFQNGKKLAQAVNRGELADPAEILGLARSFSWHMDFLPEYYVLERTIPEFAINDQVQIPRHTRRSIIQKITLPDLEPFMSELSRMTGIHFELPVAHCTLYTWSDYEPEMGSGIALNSETDFEKYKVASL